jgi:hypothetical protein
MTIRSPRTRHFINIIQKVASNPLLLLGFGALVSGLLIPQITNQWQNYQKEIQLKTDLASQISKAVASIIITSRLVQNSNFVGHQDFGNAAKEWEISRATIGSQIQAYFPDVQIKQEWDNLSKAITEFVNLSDNISNDDPNNNTLYNEYTGRLCKRIEHTLSVHYYLFMNKPMYITDLGNYNCPEIKDNLTTQKYSPVANDGINWNVLIHKELNANDDTHYNEYSKNWLSLEKDLQERKDKLIQKILKTGTPVFQSRLWL